MSITKTVVPAKKAEPLKPKAPQMSVVPKTIRGDTYMVIADAAVEPEDEFVNLYFTANQAGGIVLKPPFEPKMLRRLVTHNNVLAQCIEAMSVNIDGTGHEFLPTEEGEEVPEDQLKIAESFFHEPFPGQSFASMRRQLRDDVEAIGYGFIEVLPNVNSELVALRNHDCLTTRLIKYDDPVEVTRKITRNGTEVEIKMWARERKFLQLVNGKKQVFFREFGATRHLHRHLGHWEDETHKVEVSDRATELMMFGVNKDANGPYFLPRWINNLPAVLGSRKAEENNLEFFDAGGMPPAIIFLQGGSLVGNAADQLRQYLSPTNKQKSQAVVVEMQSNAGTLESAGSVSAKVERFGSSQASDAMFAAYDEKAEEHVRVAFRLPPLFLGKAADYNFATAQTAYMVAEAQIFQPERTEFDETVNRTIMARLKLDKVKFSSLPITLKSAVDQLKGIELVKDKISGEDLVTEINKVVGLTMEFDEEAAEEAKEAERELQDANIQALNAKANPAQAADKLPSSGKKPGTGPLDKPRTAANDPDLRQLAKKFAVITGRPGSAVFKYELGAAEQVEVIETVDALEGQRLVEFNLLLDSFSTVAAHVH